jgi:hypothetical protein
MVARLVSKGAGVTPKKIKPHNSLENRMVPRGGIEQLNIVNGLADSGTLSHLTESLGFLS